MTEWESQIPPAVEYKRDYDFDTGVENDEIQFYPPATDELDDYIQ